MGQMDREELIVLGHRIMNADAETEEENDRLIDLFEANVPRPDASDLIFWPEEATGRRRDLTPEEIVDIALSYEATPLGPASDIPNPS